MKNLAMVFSGLVKSSIGGGFGRRYGKSLDGISQYRAMRPHGKRKLTMKVGILRRVPPKTAEKLFSNEKQTM
jgi:hypothetical protein